MDSISDKMGYKPADQGYFARLVWTVGTISFFALYTHAHYRLAIDNQWFRCMEDKFFLIDISNPPTASDIQAGDVISFAMTDAQANEKLDWEVGESMAKIVLASTPGTRITVDDLGVHFEPANGKSYDYGEGLEAARMLGDEPETFHRTHVLQDGELWMMGEMPYSVDSRYYGPIDASQVTGRIIFSW